MAGNIDIGLYLSGVFLASALYTGETLAFFQWSGKIPISRLWLIISRIISEIYGVASLRSSLEILSSPQLLDVLNFNITWYTCSPVTGVNINSVDALLLMYCSEGVPVTGMFLANFSPRVQKCR